MTDSHDQLPDPECAPLIKKPAGGTPPLVTTVQGILEWCARVKADEDLAIDVERASSYRYSAKAYLVQIKTEAAGILLLDPLACQLPGTFTDIMNSHPWILHASRQDLPSLAMLGLEPVALFDTEVAARLLGLPKVSLGALTEELLDVRLAKEHSSANWSKRPLPESWLDYAALDVEYLAELKTVLTRMLDDAHKTSWAREEFAFEATFAHPEVPDEPWRGLHGLGQLKSPLQLAVARSMWERRDAIARNADVAPFMVLRDKALVAMAKASSKGDASAKRENCPAFTCRRSATWVPTPTIVRGLGATPRFSRPTSRCARGSSRAPRSFTCPSRISSPPVTCATGCGITSVQRPSIASHTRAPNRSCRSSKRSVRARGKPLKSRQRSSNRCARTRARAVKRRGPRRGARVPYRREWR